MIIGRWYHTGKFVFRYGLLNKEKEIKETKTPSLFLLRGNATINVTVRLGVNSTEIIAYFSE